MSVAARTMNRMSRSELPKEFARLLWRQHGVFSRTQAIATGISTRAADARIRRGTWSPVFPGVYRQAGHQVTWSGKVWAALLYAGRGAVLSHQTAAFLTGIIAKPGGVVHVTIPAARRVRPQPGISIHRSRRAAQIALANAKPARTSVAETLLDLSENVSAFDEVYGMICDAVANERTTEAELLTALDARPRAVWRGELRPMIAAAVAGDHSALEQRYTVDVERRHGLPSSERQVWFTTADGTNGRRDRFYREYQLIVELDGRLNHTGAAVANDRARDRAAAVAGHLTLRFGWPEVAYQACAAAADVGQVLRARGWNGRPVPCGPACRVRDSRAS